MRVYLVVTDERFYDEGFDGVFSTREKAEAYCNKNNYSYLHIEEIELDKEEE